MTRLFYELLLAAAFPALEDGVSRALFLQESPCVPSGDRKFHARIFAVNAELRR